MKSDDVGFAADRGDVGPFATCTPGKLRIALEIVGQDTGRPTLQTFDNKPSDPPYADHSNSHRAEPASDAPMPDSAAYFAIRRDGFSQ